MRSGLVGGGHLVGQFADHGLLDEILLGVAPVTLGGGAPLPPRRLLASELTLVSVENDGAFVFLTYRVGPAAQLAGPVGQLAGPVGQLEL